MTNPSTSEFSQPQYGQWSPPPARDLVGPNLIGALIASAAVVAGSAGPWATFLGFGIAGTMGDGILTLTFGAVAAVILGVQVYSGVGRIRWLNWFPVALGVGSLAVAGFDLVEFLGSEPDSDADDIFGDLSFQLGWGIIVVVLGAIALCVTATIAAVQQRKQPRVPGPVSESTKRVAIGVGLISVVLLVGGVLWRFAADGDDGIAASGDSGRATDSAGAFEPASERVPASATTCPREASDGDFRTSATGTSVTSCPFAEAVRAAYNNQSKRNERVTVEAVSPVTGQSYEMTCTGKKVVTCTGGTGAVVYLS